MVWCDAGVLLRNGIEPVRGVVGVGEQPSRLPIALPAGIPGEAACDAKIAQATLAALFSAWSRDGRSRHVDAHVRCTSHLLLFHLAHLVLLSRLLPLLLRLLLFIPIIVGFLLLHFLLLLPQPLP